MPKIYDWFAQNSFTVNVSKTQVVLNGSQKTSFPPWQEITLIYEQETLKL